MSQGLATSETTAVLVSYDEFLPCLRCLWFSEGLDSQNNTYTTQDTLLLIQCQDISSSLASINPLPIGQCAQHLPSPLLSAAAETGHSAFQQTMQTSIVNTEAPDSVNSTPQIEIASLVWSSRHRDSGRMLYQKPVLALHCCCCCGCCCCGWDWD